MHDIRVTNQQFCVERKSFILLRISYILLVFENFLICVPYLCWTVVFQDTSNYSCDVVRHSHVVVRTKSKGTNCLLVKLVVTFGFVNQGTCTSKRLVYLA